MFVKKIKCINNKKMYESRQCLSMESLLNVNVFDEETLLQDIMKQKIDKAQSFYLPNEIAFKKKQVYDLFNKKFGKKFLNLKPESLLKFERQLQKYLFDPKSKFLYHFPTLQKKLQAENGVDEEKLKTKINMGNMLFYDLRERNNKITINNTNSQEKYLSLSRNFASDMGKDVVINHICKVKFWDKNAKRINKIMAKKKKSRKELNIFESLNEEEIKQQVNNNEKSISNNENIENNYNSIENLISIDKNNITDSPNRGTGGYKRLFFLNKTNNNENLLHNKFFIPKSNINNFSNKLNLKPRKNLFNSTKIKKNLFRESTDYISRNSDINTLNFGKSHGSFKNLKYFSYNKTNNITDTYNKYNSTIKTNSSSINTEKHSRKRSTNFKMKFDNQITKLNNQTCKCNYKLYKLIDENNTENIPSKAEISKTKVDLIELLNGEEKKLQKKSLENENIIKIVTDINNEEKNKNNRRILRKKINHLPDDLALIMVGHFIGDKYKEINIDEILEGLKRKKAETQGQKLNISRKKLENNYNKIIKLRKNLYYDHLKALGTKAKKTKKNIFKINGGSYKS